MLRLDNTVFKQSPELLSCPFPNLSPKEPASPRKMLLTVRKIDKG